MRWFKALKLISYLTTKFFYNIYIENKVVSIYNICITFNNVHNLYFVSLDIK